MRYYLRALGIRTKFYKMAGKYPKTAKMVITGLEKRSGLFAAGDMEEVMEKLKVKITTQLIKEVATIKFSN